MFSMCSELTPRAHVPDNRIPQLMQPCSVAPVRAVSAIPEPLDMAQAATLNGGAHTQVTQFKKLQYVSSLNLKICELST